MFNIEIIHQEVIDKTTQAKDQIIHFLALLAFSSSQREIKYIIPLKTKAKTAKTATNCISCEIRFDIAGNATSHHDSNSQIELESQPGNQAHVNQGASALDIFGKNKNDKKEIKRYFIKMY